MGIPNDRADPETPENDCGKEWISRGARPSGGPLQFGIIKCGEPAASGGPLQIKTSMVKWVALETKDFNGEPCKQGNPCS